MQLNKTQNASRNILFGLLMKVYQIILPFIFRTIMVYTLGVQYLGLNSLFSSVMQVLNLAELGVGSAMVFSMYEPIAKDNAEKISALMNLYKIYYRLIGLFILVVGLSISPLVPKLISGEIPDGINIYILYILNLFATVLTYWLFAYRNSILQAHQRVDVSSKVIIATDTFKYLLQLVALFGFHNYYYYVVSILISQTLSNLTVAYFSHKLFPQYRTEGKIDYEEKKAINRRIRDLFTSKLGGVVVNSADTLVISSFLGLRTLAIYQNYFYIINSVFALITIINNSVLAGIGNNLILKDSQKNYIDFKKFLFIEVCMFGVCIAAFSSLFQPFMTMWMGKDLLLDYSIVILLCVYFFGYEYVMLLSVYKDAAGIWHEDRFRPLISGVLNLVLNLFLVKVIGLYGIVVSTIISVYFVSAPWITKNVFSNIFPHHSIKKYLYRFFYYVLTIICNSIIVNVLCGFIPYTLAGFGLRMIACLSISMIVFIIAFHRMTEFKDSIVIAKKMIIKNRI